MKKIIFDKEKFIKDYDELKSSRKMGERYNCSKGVILKYAKSIGYDTSLNKEKKVADKDPEEIYQLYLKEKSLDKVGEKYQCSGTSIGNFLTRNGYKVENFLRKLSNISPADFIGLYDELKSAEKVGKALGCSHSAVLAYAKKINYDTKSNKNYKLNEQQKREILEAYNSEMSSNDLAKKYNVSRGMITKLWYDNCLHGKIVSNPKTTEIDMQDKTFNEWTVLYKTDKRGPQGSILWHCRCSCGVERDVLGTALRNGTSFSCGHILSKGNLKITLLLLKNNILFETEKRFPSCRDKLELPFDFYISNSYLLEFDGELHFKDAKNHWNTPDKFEYTKRHDDMKNQWCKENHIPLIRIPYNKLDTLTIEDILLDSTPYRII